MIQTDAKLALKWGCDSRTIRRWRKDGAPLENTREMMPWLSGRKHLPPGTAAIVSKQAAGAISKIATTNETEGSNSEGAAGALRRLESAERTTYRMLQSALRSGSPPAIKASRENWLAVGNQLRQYDRQVERDRRDSGELVPRAEMEAAVNHFMHHLRMASRQSAMSMAPRLVHTDIIALSEGMRVQFWDNMIASLAMLSSRPCQSRLPAWWLAAAVKDLGDAFQDVPGTVDRRREALEAAFEMCIESNTDQRMDQINPPPAEGATVVPAPPPAAAAPPSRHVDAAEGPKVAPAT